MNNEGSIANPNYINEVRCGVKKDMKKKGLFIFFLFAIILLFALFRLEKRYLSWGIDIENLIYFEMISGMSLVVMFLSFNNKKNPINPYFLYSIFVFLLGYSFVPLNSNSNLLNRYTLLLLILTVFFFLIGLFCGSKLRLQVVPLKISINSRIFIFWGTLILSVLVFFLECARIGYIPILNVLSMDVYGDTNANLIPVLHYFVLAANIIPIWAYLLYKHGSISKRKRNIAILISLFIIMNSLSRQMWLLSLICIGFCYMFIHRIPRWKLLICMLIPVFLFLAMGAIRLITKISDGRSNVEYLRDYSSTQYDVNLLEAYMGLYSSNNFTKFDTFVCKSDEVNYRGYGVYTLRPVYTLLLLNRFEEFDINPDFDSFTSLATYAIEPYLDFGILGVIILNFIYGFFSAYVYCRYEKKFYRWIIPWGCIAFCILMGAFTNYFNTFFIWFVITLNFLILPPINYAKRN